MKKENLDPGVAESFTECKCLSSVEVGDNFQWVRVARKMRQTETIGIADSRNSPEKSVDTSTMSNMESSNQT